MSARHRASQLLIAHDLRKRVAFVAGDRALSDDIRRDLIFDEGDAIAQLQLAFLHPLQAQQIGSRRLMEGIIRRVEIAVFLLQPCKLGLQLALIFVGHDVR